MEVYRKLQGILNKLTPQKFQTLAEQALKLKINTEERLSRCVEMVLNNVSSDELRGEGKEDCHN